MPQIMVASMWSWIASILNVVILFLGLVLVFLVLIQRGKGGGLAGAFGGAGGSSAFGTRAGDRFTKITIGVAIVWLLLLMGMVKVVQRTAQVDQGADGGLISGP